MSLRDAFYNISKFYLEGVTHSKKFSSDFDRFKQLAGQAEARFELKWSDRLRCLADATSETPFDAHYIYFPAWAARILAQTKPKKHVDISSTLHFCSLVSAFMPFEFYDYRPVNLKLSNLKSKRADITSLPFRDNSIVSLSSMHVVEHIGLGRYGDPLDYDGDLKAISELKRVLKKGGDLLFVVPIGKPRIKYNAHRIYSHDQIVSYFEDFTLRDFSLITDDRDKGIINNASKKESDSQRYGCGCFWFIKK